MLKKLDRPLLLALLIPVFAIAPLAQHAGIPNLADGLIHLLRQVAFDRALRAGALVPRWGADLYLGFGYPLYIFAPPLLSYAIESFHLLGLAMDDALKLCIILICELYSVGMFLFMRAKVGTAGALVAAALNVYAPFRLRELLVTGGNYPQFLALALFPFILWAFDDLIRTQARRYLLAAALSYAALALSHIFHALIFTPVLIAYVLWRLLATRAPRHAWSMALLASVSALALSAFFWLPAITERSSVRATEEAFESASDFHQRFLTPARLLAPPQLLDAAEANVDVPLSLGWAQMVLGIVGMLAAFWQSIRARQPARIIEPLIFLIIFLVALFLQLPASAPLWDRAPFLPLAEFPWRFMGLSAFTLAALGGYSLSLIRSDDLGRSLTIEIATTLVVAIAIISAFPYLSVPRGFVQVGTPSAQTVLTYEQSTGALGLTTLNEYLPLTVQQPPADMPAPLSQPKLDLRSLPALNALQSAQWSPLGESDAVQLAQPTTLRFRTFAYPGWAGYLDGQKTPLIVQRDGTMAMAVPAGEHQIEVRFEETTLRWVSEIISLVVLLILAFVALMRPPALKTAGDKDDARSSELGWRAFALMTFVLTALFIVKIVVVDAQGWLRVSRLGQPAATFDGQIELLGSESDEQVVARGGELHARFFWRAAQPLKKNYHVIAQLIGQDGQAVAGSDKQHPGDPVVQGETPTTRFEPGQYVRDEHQIVVPATISPGRYELRVGWYDPAAGKRLKLPNGETLFVTRMIDVR